MILASPTRCPTLIVDLITNYSKSVSNVNHVVCLKLTAKCHLLAYDDSLQNQLLAFLFICLMKPYVMVMLFSRGFYPK